MENQNQDWERTNGYFSKKLRAGKRRTYFFDVRSTKGNDYYLTITESKKRPNGSGYDSHKVFLYKEDFKKFIESLEETLHHIKTELMPDFDFDNFTRETYFENKEKTEYDAPEESKSAPLLESEPKISMPSQDVATPSSEQNQSEDVDTW